MHKKINLKNIINIILGIGLSSLILGYAASNIFLTITIILGIYFIIKNKKISIDNSLIVIFIFYIWFLIQLFFIGFDKYNSSYTLLLSIVILPLFIKQFPKLSTQDLTFIIRIFSSALILYMFCCLNNSYVIYLYSKDISVFFYHTLVTLFKNHAIYISLFSSFSMLCLINQETKLKFIDYLLIFLLFIFLIILGSKNIMITTVIIQIILMILKKNIKKVTLISISIMLILSTFIISTTNNSIKNRFIEETKYLDLNKVMTNEDMNEVYWTGTSLRIFQIRAGIDIIKNNIGFTGIGLKESQKILDSYYNKYNIGYYNTYNFHNQYLQTLIDGGIIGLILLLVVFIYCFIMSIKQKNIPLSIFTLLMFFLFFTEVVFARQKGVIFFGIIYALVHSGNVRENILYLKTKN